MTISIDQLPTPESISCRPIATAVTAFHEAKHDREQRRKDLVDLEQTREAAEWRDAEAAEKARSEGKQEPKRTHVAAHDRKTDEARHELKVAELALERARETLVSALDEHGDAWAAEVEKELEALDTTWAAAVNALVGLHGNRAQATAIARVVGVERAGVGVLGFKLGQIDNLEFQPQQSGKLGYVQTADVLALLGDLGQWEPEREHVERPPLKPLPNPAFDGHGGVEAERAERDAFFAALEHAA